MPLWRYPTDDLAIPRWIQMGGRQHDEPAQAHGHAGMKLYHRTDVAEEILTNGFRDGRDTYLTKHVYEGVWFSDQPLGENDGLVGEDLLTIEMPEEKAVEF